MRSSSSLLSSHARIRLVALLLSLAATTSALVGLNARPAAAATTTTTITLSPARQYVPYASTAKLVATLTAGQTRLGGRAITVWVLRPDRTWQYYATVKTNSSGQAGILRGAYASNVIQARYAGRTGWSASRSNHAEVLVTNPGQRYVNEASRHVGKPYQWGATGPSRFDCSGFTLYVFSRFGKQLPHNSSQQYGAVRHIATSQKRVGDLIFTHSGGRIHHVAIYAGNGYIWDSPHSGSHVSKRKMWTSSYYVGRV